MQNNSSMKGTVGILLMTYGSATTAENVRSYMEHIYKGKASDELVKDFEERYRLVGRSPLVEITKQQAGLLEVFLDRDNSATAADSAGQKYIVRAAMLHSAPLIDDMVLELKNAGATALRGIILSPQFSSFIMDGYTMALMRAAEEHGFSKESVLVAGSWPADPHFITLLANRVRDSLRTLQEKYQTDIPVLFTTHSLPQRVVDKDPNYLKELQQTIDAVLAKLGLESSAPLEWQACYQSAGHTPEEWLKPDLKDILFSLHKKKVPAALIVPIQFLADHLEILYDLDVAAKKQCDEYKIDYHRIALPNTDPMFIEALANVTKNTF